MQFDFGEVLKDALMHTPHVAVLVVDQHGRIQFVNKTYQRVLRRTWEELIGRPIAEFTPESRTLTVLKTGEAIVGYNWTVNDHHGVAASLPLFKDGKIIGCFAYSLFLDVYDGRSMMEKLIHELNMYRDAVSSLYAARYSFRHIVGQTPAMRNVITLAQQVARHAATTVLITGESGTGKELFAHAIHGASSRSHHPFVRINCAAIPENLLEAELFGYEEGAYTGARRGGKPGKFELANGGTVFLDEIAELPLPMQSKLLVVLQEREIERLGGNRPIKVNVRVLAATSRQLEKMVEQGRFREDLFYRLNVVRLEIPPLRSRIPDIPLIVDYFLPILNLKLRTSIEGVTPAAAEILTRYPWPGNVRELENVLERAMILADMEKSGELTPRHLAFVSQELDRSAVPGEGSLWTLTEAFEKQVIRRALEESGQDRLEAARQLKIDPSSLYRKLKKYRLGNERVSRRTPSPP